ncbi:uroporphyrin-III methyltransferase [Candidatus Protochlamydia naegleriophila]|uniref:Uroporphyrin-III methyltransferase n=1 Tax=Candidatus Protochlamydia naegleriophila TaxID=389348 RepID=A0A0U5K0X0_9BACT|nr:DUF488 domain-containing protein [Candidatus Protochlamydia naegleriophila]CUI15755.1 uroporphyrin-III methyltransferase [Candidatus Protochlamydia naegleriophila]
MKIQLKRVYDPATKDDGMRILVERLWPRGIKKEDLDLDLWLKEIAPSTELRQWFSHDSAKWQEFEKKYKAELDHTPEAVAQIFNQLKHSTITLLYSSKDTEHNSALYLQHYLEDKIQQGH